MEASYLNVEWLGCAFGVLGSGLLALNARCSGWGFVLFFVSNLFWIGFALAHQNYGLLFQQMVFLLTSAIGIYRWLVRPTTRSGTTLEMAK